MHGGEESSTPCHRALLSRPAESVLGREVSHSRLEFAGLTGNLPTRGVN
jgi:hypothetical protein